MGIVSTLIDKARERSGIESDSALAAHFGIHRQAVSKWRTEDAYPDEDNIAAMAEMAGEDPAQWLVAVKAVRSSGPAGKAWAALARKLAVTSALLALVIFPALPRPAQAATAAVSTASSYALCEIKDNGSAICARASDPGNYRSFH